MIDCLPSDASPLSSSALIVIVSGLPRSGTSMLMRMLQAGGLPLLTDGKRSPDPDNPLGYFEYEPVKALDRGDAAWLEAAAGKATKIVSALLVQLPHVLARRYVVLFMRRPMAEILASQRRMLQRRGADADAVPDDRMAEVYRAHLSDVDRWIDTREDVLRLDVPFVDVIAEPRAEAATIAALLRREANVILDEAAMAKAVEPDLYRNRALGSTP